MPIYEYYCPHCQIQFDQLQRITDKPLVTCPSCNKDGLQKLVSLTSFQLKGSGWSKTGYIKGSGA